MQAWFGAERCGPKETLGRRAAIDLVGSKLEAGAAATDEGHSWARCMLGVGEGDEKNPGWVCSLGDSYPHSGKFGPVLAASRTWALLAAIWQGPDRLVVWPEAWIGSRAGRAGWAQHG